MSEKQPTIEELQAEIIQLKKDNETNNAKISTLQDQNSTLTKDLNASRDINGQLWKSVGSINGMMGVAGEPTPEPEPTPDEMLESIANEAMAPNLKRMKLMYGEYINTELIDKQTDN